MFDRAFWADFDGALAESRSAQPTPLSAALDEFFVSDAFKSALASVIKAAFEDGVLHERARIAAAWAVGERDAVDRPTESTFH